MMARISTARTVDTDFWEGRLKQARAFQQAGENLVALANPGDNLSPAISNIVLAAIAYADAITAKHRRLVNTQDHGAAPRLLRDTLGNTLPGSQESRLRKLLSLKDSAQYGARPTGLSQAQQQLADLQEFALWAEQQL
jgi:hypothetical protein